MTWKFGQSVSRSGRKNSMQITNVPIDSIHLDPANVRVHPEDNLAGIKASLARFGQQRPLLVDSAGIVRAGNGTLMAARELGWSEIAIVRTDLTGSEATGYSIADNRTAEKAEWEKTALAKTLRALQSEDFDLTAVGFDDGEVDALLAGLADDILAAAGDGDGSGGGGPNDPRGEWQGMPEFEHEDLTAEAAFVIRVFLKNDEDLAEFGKLLGKDLTGRKFVWFSDQPRRRNS